MDIGNAIRKFRKDRNISQEALAYDVGIARSHIFKIEKGISSPTVGLLEKIAKRFDCHVFEIIRFAEIGE